MPSAGIRHAVIDSTIGHIVPCRTYAMVHSFGDSEMPSHGPAAYRRPTRLYLLARPEEYHQEAGTSATYMSDTFAGA